MEPNNARIKYENCPLCDSTRLFPRKTADCRSHPLHHPVIGNFMNWVQCRECFHVFTDGYFTPEACAKVFSKTNESQKVGHDLERQRFVSARMVEKVMPYAQSGDWLDIGFGNGSLLLTAKEYGFEPVGIDLREKNVAELNGLGISGFCMDIKDIWKGDSYSVISMADVLEHMPFPKQALIKAGFLLIGGGVLLISLPNMDSPLWAAMDDAGINPYWGEIEHYHNFGRRRLYALLEECGFRPVRYGVSERYRCCMEIVAVKEFDATNLNKLSALTWEEAYGATITLSD